MGFFLVSAHEALKHLPEGYIYPKEQRAVRDLLRRRLFFVRHRTANILSLQSTITRNLGIKISNNDIKKLNMNDVYDLFDSSNLFLWPQIISLQLSIWEK